MPIGGEETSRAPAGPASARRPWPPGDLVGPEAEVAPNTPGAPDRSTDGTAAWAPPAQQGPYPASGPGPRRTDRPRPRTMTACRSSAAAAQPPPAQTSTYWPWTRATGPATSV